MLPLGHALGPTLGLLASLLVPAAGEATPASNTVPGPSGDLAAAPRVQPIVGGELTANGEFATVVAVLVGNRVCTGTVVSESLVLTAAHCFANEPDVDDILIAYGNEISNMSLVAARGYGVHPSYTGDSDGKDIYDFAYVTVQGAFEFPNGFVLPLATQDEWDEAMVVGSPVMLVGFGEDPDDLSGPIGRKRKVLTSISRFTDSGLEFFAGGDGRDSCSGDSGGPAFVQIADGTVRLAGILSRGSDPCGDGGYYGVAYAALGWVRAETGVDMLPAGCEEGDCLDISPDNGGACNVGGRNGSPLFLLTILSLGIATRRRPRGRL